MTNHIIWAVVWFVLMLVSFYGGTLLGGLIMFGSAGMSFLKEPGRRTRSWSFGLSGAFLMVFGWAFAVYSLIKMVLQIVAAFHS